MAPRRQNIDAEWAESLVGMRLCVPEHWWLKMKSKKLHDGKLSSFDVSSQKWMLVLDSEDDANYPIAYTAIYLYADQDASTYEDFNLPPQPVLEGVEEDVVVRNTTYEVTASDRWKKIDSNNVEENNNMATVIEPIPWDGESKEFTVNADEDEIGRCVVLVQGCNRAHVNTAVIRKWRWN